MNFKYDKVILNLNSDNIVVFTFINTNFKSDKFTVFYNVNEGFERTYYLDYYGDEVSYIVEDEVEITNINDGSIFNEEVANKLIKEHNIQLQPSVVLLLNELIN